MIAIFEYDALTTHAGVEALYSFVGTGGPPFYYNLQKTPRAPNLARLVVRTDGLARNQELIEFLDDYKQTHLPSAQIIAHKLSQGPLVTAPLEVEIYADTAAERLAATDKIYGVLRDLPGTRNVRHTLGSGVPGLDLLRREDEPIRVAAHQYVQVSAAGDGDAREIRAR